MARAVLILANDQVRQRAHRWIDALPEKTRVEFKEPKRTLDQNAKMWAMLTDVATQMRWHGLKLTPDDWKLIFLASLSDEARLVPNLDGNGFVNLGRSSSDLSVGEMRDMIELMYAWGANPEHPIKWSDPKEPASLERAVSA